VGMAGECAPYDGLGEAAKEECQKSEIKLIDPGMLPVFTDSVMAGAVQKL
jgi:hypothetical protein